MSLNYLVSSTIFYSQLQLRSIQFIQLQFVIHTHTIGKHISKRVFVFDAGVHLMSNAACKRRTNQPASSKYYAGRLINRTKYMIVFK